MRIKMISILISCFLGISLSLLFGWLITYGGRGFFTRFLQQRNWEKEFEFLINSKKGMSRNFESVKPEKVSKSSQKQFEEKENSQQGIWSKVKGSSEVLLFLKSCWDGDKRALKEITPLKFSGTLLKIEDINIQLVFRTVLLEFVDFSQLSLKAVKEKIKVMVFIQLLKDGKVISQEELLESFYLLTLSKCGWPFHKLGQGLREGKIKSSYKQLATSKRDRALKELFFTMVTLSQLKSHLENIREKALSSDFGKERQKNTHHKKAHQDLFKLNPSQLKDALSIFEISCSKDKALVKKTYRKLALKFHPDRSEETREKVAHRQFVIIQQAYETLLKSA